MSSTSEVTMSQYVIEVKQFDPATHEFSWVTMAPSGLCSRPLYYESQEKAQRVVDVCFPKEHALQARVTEVVS